MELIVRSAGFEHVDKGKWVFREGDKGEEFYLLLHGEC